MALMFRSVLQSGGGAELIVTCDSEFAGVTISCSDGTTTLNKTCPVSSPYEVTFKIPNSGDWTISATVSGTTYSSDPISVDLDYETDLEFGFNWRRWVDTAQYLDSTDYSTLSGLLADEEAVRELCLEHACVDYLCTSAVVNSVLAEVIGSDLFAKWVNNSDYALDKMYANAAIKTAMDTADKYGYGEWALMPQVPTMTSNTAPYGEVIYDGTLYFENYAWKAFDRSEASGYGTTTFTNTYIGYVFPSAVRIDAIKYLSHYAYPERGMKNFRVEYSLDGTANSWVSVYTGIGANTTNYQTFEFDNNVSARYWRVYVIDTISTSGDFLSFLELQFYAWQPKGNVPVMTSNTAPYGEASAYQVFDGNASTTASGTDFSYKFVNPICPKDFYCNVSGGTLQASNDGSTWSVPTSGSYYLYLRLHFASSVSPHTIQFYGRELSVSVPVMTGDTAPYGSVIKNSEESNNPVWHLFDNNDNDVWSTPPDGQINAKAGYTFTHDVCIKSVSLVTYYDTNSKTNYTLDVIGVNADLTEETIASDIPITNTADKTKISFTINNSKSYRGYYLLFPEGTATRWCSMRGLQFYGKDYSEKEFEDGTTKKWLYDHGVELEEVMTYVSGGGVVTKRADDIYVMSPDGSQARVYCVYEVAGHSLLRAKVGREIVDYTVNNVTSHNQILVATLNDSRLAYIDMLKVNDPNNHGLDVSSVSSGYYPFIQGNGHNRVTTLKEFWLE